MRYKLQRGPDTPFGPYNVIERGEGKRQTGKFVGVALVFFTGVFFVAKKSSPHPCGDL